MPEISRFFGIVIGMFYDDHNPPHFHVRYGEHKATFRIKDFSLRKGYLPSRAMGLVIEWASSHKQELMENWERARQDKELLSIHPLE